MSLMILITGAALCNAADYPMDASIFYPCAIYAVIHDFFRSATVSRRK